ncbi:MAG: glycoside hydrolase family 44 protein, partial [Deltaproteobacteria bacterium]|nr:glycoside hydrolase family 44 protein [Deltaproteobacteria bacterium]
ATAGNQQVALNWNASNGATSYPLARSTSSAGPFTSIATPTTTSYTDQAVANGTIYYYEVAAANASGASANSAAVSATPIQGTTAVNLAIDVLTDRHSISPYIYGGSYPKDAAHITDSGTTVVRWGGNATSTYNWQLFTNNAAADWYFEDFDYTEIGDGDSAKFIQDVKTAGSNPLMTLATLPWVAKSAENAGNGHWSFSNTKYGTQCASDPYNSDAGNGLKPDCKTQLTANPNDAYVPLLDKPGTSDPPGSVYRNQWVAALATAFGNAPHFYNMDNESDIWGGTHRDIHPSPAAYDELRDTYLTEARNLKTWDPQALRLGPVSCCWWFYWNGANGSDKGSHGGVDFLPWWLNEVYWRDQIAGTRSLDIFDVHAYPDPPDTSSLTQAQKQALTARIYRDYWDSTYVSESTGINQPWATQLQPNKTIPFRIPRLRALVNSIYPSTPLSFTEWSAAFAGEGDFSTAIADADAYGILGRERVYLGSRWEAPDPANPNYQALKLFTNYDGAHHGFAPISLSTAHNADPNLFSAYAAANAAGTSLTVMVINKDPANAVQAHLSFLGFTPTQVASYSLTRSSPTAIVASGSQSWTSSLSFAPYSITLLLVSGTTATIPAAEWDLNPDTTMVAAGGTVTLAPRIVSGSGTVTLGSPTSGGGITVTVTQSTVNSTQNGAVTVVAGTMPGFYHFDIPGTDNSGVTSTQGGWIVVGNPAAGLTKTGGDNQTGTHGNLLSQALTVSLSPGQSGGSGAGASILFSTSAGTLSSGSTTGSKVIVVTNNSGIASVNLTLPASPQSLQVTAEGPYALGHPQVIFNETAQ